MTTRKVRKTEKRSRRKRRKVSVKRKIGRIEKIRRKTERRLEMGEAREKVKGEGKTKGDKEKDQRTVSKFSTM